jgi:hypothetical protein
VSHIDPTYRCWNCGSAPRNPADIARGNANTAAVVAGGEMPEPFGELPSRGVELLLDTCFCGASELEHTEATGHSFTRPDPEPPPSTGGEQS